MIKIDGVDKYFGRLAAVRALSLNIGGGEFYCLLGPNGAGKTTTLKMISGLMRPTKGTIALGGFDIEKDPLSAKKILGFVPDQPFLYEHLTAFEFLDFAARIFDVEKKKYMEIRDRYFSLFDIDRITHVGLVFHMVREKIVYI